MLCVFDIETNTVKAFKKSGIYEPALLILMLTDLSRGFFARGLNIYTRLISCTVEYVLGAVCVCSEPCRSGPFASFSLLFVCLLKCYCEQVASYGGP